MVSSLLWLAGWSASSIDILNLRASFVKFGLVDCAGRKYIHPWFLSLFRFVFIFVFGPCSHRGVNLPLGRSLCIKILLHY